MIASNVSEATLLQAAADCLLRLDITPLSASGRRFRVKVYPGDLRDSNGNHRYQRTSANALHPARRVHAVCWHGFRDFFRAAFRYEPEAVFRTALATWRGSDHFEAYFMETANKNVGSQMLPRRITDCCTCQEEGRTR
jgi:hypothetical protein